MKDFKNKVAAITGAGSGMGRTLALELARRGCHLALSDVNEKGLAETAELAKASGVKITTIKLDVANREAMYGWADQVVRDHGQVNLIFNNAGVALGAFLDTVSPKDFEWIMGINFWGVVYGTKAFLPMMQSQNDGVIVNISSVFGIIAVPTQSSYNAAKFAVRGFTESLRHELAGSGVSAICVHPGGIKTNIAASSRFYVDPQGLSDAKKAAANFQKLAQTTPAQAAQTIVSGIEQGNPRVLIGGDAKVIDWVQRLMPVNYWKLMQALMKRMKK